MWFHNRVIYRVSIRFSSTMASRNMKTEKISTPSNGCEFAEAAYAGAMNTKTIVIGVIVIILVAAGLYFIVKSPSTNTSGATATTTANTADASSSDQVQAQDVTVGTGAQATPGSVVSVLYVGYLGTVSTSTVFDSSAAHGNQPLSFTLGAQGLIPGFQIGVNGMKVGGERLMAIPASLGYGT